MTLFLKGEKSPAGATGKPSGHLWWPPVPPDPEQAPFVIELGKEPIGKPEEDGNYAAFAPTARLVLMPTLRTSGLLAALPGEEAKTLLFVLSFLTPNGFISPGLAQIADTMQVAVAKARGRLARLEQFRWQGEPLVRLIPTQGEWGVERCALSPRIVAVRKAPEPEPPALPLPMTVSREEVIARSRERYARPREEAERLVLEQLGHNGDNAQEEGADKADSATGGRDRPRGSDPFVPPEAPDTPRPSELVGLLEAYGITPYEAMRLVADYPAERILRQVSWMGFRGVRDSARFLAAAIARDFGEPPGARAKRLESEAAKQELQERQQGEAVPRDPGPAGNEGRGG